MHFHHRRFDSRNGIADSHRRMGVSTWIENNAINGETHILQVIDQFTFHVALKILKLHIGVFFLQGRKICFKILVAVYFRFSFSQQVQVRSIDDGDVHATKISSSARFCLKSLILANV